MKSLLYLLLSILLFSSFVDRAGSFTECDVYCFYTSEYAPIGSKGLSLDGEVIELKNILTPYNELEDGKYSVSITEVADNYYSIDGTDIIFESTICLEVAEMDDVLIRVRNLNGFSFGTVFISDK